MFISSQLVNWKITFLIMPRNIIGERPQKISTWSRPYRYKISKDYRVHVIFIATGAGQSHLTTWPLLTVNS